MSASNGKLTPTEQRIYDCLADGLPHWKKDLHCLLWDELGTQKDRTVARHISILRKKVASYGLDIAIKFINKRLHYMMVRPISAGE